MATVVRVVDGDTVDVDLRGRRERLRLIGLDTPESVDPRQAVQCFGRVASARMAELLPVGLRVELEGDPTQANRDTYGCLLRYVYLPNGWNAAEVMIREGFGFEYTFRLPYRYQDVFKEAQREAREAERGLWAPTACAGEARPLTGLPSTAPPSGPTVEPRSVDTTGAHPCQPGQIKGNQNSGIYHAPGQQYYARTYANVQCFDSESEAAAAGFRRAKR